MSSSSKICRGCLYVICDTRPAQGYVDRVDRTRLPLRCAVLGCVLQRVVLVRLYWAGRGVAGRGGAGHAHSQSGSGRRGGSFLPISRGTSVCTLAVVAYACLCGAAGSRLARPAPWPASAPAPAPAPALSSTLHQRSDGAGLPLLLLVWPLWCGPLSSDDGVIVSPPSFTFRIC